MGVIFRIRYLDQEKHITATGRPLYDNSPSKRILLTERRQCVTRVWERITKQPWNHTSMASVIKENNLIAIITIKRQHSWSTIRKKDHGHLVRILREVTFLLPFNYIRSSQFHCFHIYLLLPYLCQFPLTFKFQRRGLGPLCCSWTQIFRIILVVSSAVL